MAFAHAHHDMSSNALDNTLPYCSVANTSVSVSTSIQREQISVSSPTKEFMSVTCSDTIFTISSRDSMSTASKTCSSMDSNAFTRTIYTSTPRRGIVSSQEIVSGEFKSPSNTQHGDRYMYSGDRITGEHESNRSYAYTGVFDESNRMNRYAEYDETRYEGACGNNYDWDHTDLGSSIFHERAPSSDVENTTYSTPRRTSIHDHRNRNESNYESRYMSDNSRNFEESQTSNRGEGSNYRAYSYTHEPHSSDYSQTRPSYTQGNSNYRRVRFSDPSDSFQNQWPYLDSLLQSEPTYSNSEIKRKPKEPQTFDGTSDFQDYIIHFEQVAIWNKWNEHEKAQQLAMCLRGQAQKILSDLTLGQMNRYSEVRAAIERRFNPPGRETAYKCEMRNKRLQQSESVSQFGYSLRRLSSLAYPDMTRDAREVYAIDQFINGLTSHEMKKHVQFHHPKTLDEAITFAVEYEAFDGPYDITRKPDKASVQVVSRNADVQSKFRAENTPNVSDTSVSDLTKVISEGFEKLGDLITKSQRQGPFRRQYKPCHKCGKKGHPHFKCPNTQNAQSEETQVKSPPSGDLN